MKKYSIICAFALLLATGCGTESHPDSTDAEIEASILAGHRDAERALTLPENTMAREAAILDMRSRETRLRDAGRPSCADAYAEAVESVLFNNSPANI